MSSDAETIDGFFRMKMDEFRIAVNTSINDSAATQVMNEMRPMELNMNSKIEILTRDMN